MISVIVHFRRSKMDASIVVAGGAKETVAYVHSGRLYVGEHRTELLGVISACIHWDETLKELYVGSISTDKSACVLRVTPQGCDVLSKQVSDMVVRLKPGFVTGDNITMSFLPKRPSSVRFAGSPVSLIVSDGFGDVFKLPIRESCDLRDAEIHEKHCVFGHFALVTDCTVSNTSDSDVESFSLIASSDREGRIRLSRFPDAFVVEAFFLYHKTYVTACAWIPQSNSRRLLSADGDGIICLWDVHTPDEPLSVFKFDTESGQSTVVCSVDVHPLEPNYAVVIVDKHPSLYVLRGASSGNELIKVAEYSLGDNKPISAAFFDSSGKLWVSSDMSKEVTGLKVTVTCGDAVGFEVGKVLAPILEEEKKEEEKSGTIEIHNRSVWLNELKKKAFVEGWKGKKRKMSTLEKR